MQDQLAVVRDLPESSFQHFSDLQEVGARGQRVANNFPIEEVHDWGKIALLAQ